MIKEAIEFHIEGMTLDSKEIQITILSSEEMEDIALANTASQGRTGEYIDTVEFLKKLDAKTTN